MLVVPPPRGGAGGLMVRPLPASLEPDWCVSVALHIIRNDDEYTESAVALARRVRRAVNGAPLTTLDLEAFAYLCGLVAHDPDAHYKLAEWAESILLELPDEIETGTSAGWRRYVRQWECEQDGS